MEEEGNLTVLKVVLLSICAVVISSFILFFIAVARVDAAEYTGAYDRTTGDEKRTNASNGLEVDSGSTTIGNVTRTGIFTNYNKIGVYYHTNMEIKNGSTYQFQFQVTVRLQPVVLSAMPCDNWGISAFSIRYPSNLNAMASNQVTTINDNVSRGTCVVQGSSENILMQTYIYTGNFTATRDTNMIGARFQIYTDRSAYMQEKFYLMSLTITQVGGSDPELIGTINNSTNNVIQQNKANTDRILDGLEQWQNRWTLGIDAMTGVINGAGHTITQIQQQKLDVLHSQVGGLSGLESAITQKQQTRAQVQAIVDNGLIGGQTGVLGDYYGQGLNNITSAWDIFLRHSEIMTVLTLVLSLGIIKHLANR